MHTTSDHSMAAPPEDTVRQVALQALQRYEGQQGNLLPVLHAVQEVLGYIPPAAVPVLAEAMQLSRAEIHGVISFYAHLRDKPSGKVVLEVCRAEACQAMGGERLAEHARHSLGCDFHATTADGRVTLEPVYCLGLCAQSPSVMIDGRPHARMTADKLDALLRAKGVQL